MKGLLLDRGQLAIPESQGHKRRMVMCTVPGTH